VQNYKRLGLLSKLNGRSGGSEKTSATTKDGAHHDALALNTPARTSKTLQPTETKVERDPETGAILRIIEAPSTKPNPLNDPLNDLSDDEEDEFHGIADKHVKSDVVKALEESATMEIKLRPRQQSAREEEWIADLVNKYGDDYGKMARDMKLNPYQQTTGDISRRVKQWKKKQNKV
jgi:nucleolar protein 16